MASAAAAGAIAFQDPRLASPESLSVSIAGVSPGGALPLNYAVGGRNLSPPVAWTKGPPGVRAYALVMQDADAPGDPAAVHWLAYAIPANLAALPRGMKNLAEPTSPLGVLQGANYHGGLGYSGPNPPPQDPPHHYHLQVFALNAPVRLHPGADLPDVERAMAGHVVAGGELVTTFQVPKPKAAPGSAPASPASPGAPG